VRLSRVVTIVFLPREATEAEDAEGSELLGEAVESEEGVADGEALLRGRGGMRRVGFRRDQGLPLGLARHRVRGVAAAAARRRRGRCGCGVDCAGFGFKPMSCKKGRLGLDPLCWMVACAGKNIFGPRNHEMGSFSERGNFLKF
jgi:hypothetical protein